MAALALKPVEEAWWWIRDNFNRLQGNCKDAGQIQQLVDLYSASRDAYFHALVTNLADDNAIVKKLTAELKATNKQLRQMLGSLQNVAKVIALLTEAVKLAGAIATLAAV